MYGRELFLQPRSQRHNFFYVQGLNCQLWQLSHTRKRHYGPGNKVAVFVVGKLNVKTGGGVPRSKRHYGTGIEVAKAGLYIQLL